MRAAFASFLLVQCASLALAASTVTVTICEANILSTPVFPASSTLETVQTSPVVYMSSEIEKSTKTTPSSPQATEVSQLTTSIVTVTSVYTVSSCAPDVVNCPYGSKTSTIYEYTTICPVTETQTSPLTGSSAVSSPVVTAYSSSIFYPNATRATSSLESTTSPVSAISLNSTIRSTTSSLSTISLNSTTQSTTSSLRTTTSSVNACATDLCGQEIFPTSQAPRTEDCSSYFSATVYPTTVTEIVTAVIIATVSQNVTTATVTLTDTEYPLTATESIFIATETITDVTGTTTIAHSVVPLVKKTFSVTPTPITVAPTSIPAYASDCSGPSYSSVCSCAGVSWNTTTLSIPTTTITVELLATETVTENLIATTETTLSETKTITIDLTTTTTQNAVATATANFDGLCQNGLFVDGADAPCFDCEVFNLRVEGQTDTIFEGPIRTGPRNITTASGGTHLCNGQNDGANRNPSGTSTTALDSAAGLCGFSYDGTYDSSFEDFFIERISNSVQTSTQFWGLLNNFQFTPVGGCQEEPAPGDEILWAYDAFNANLFLDVQPRTVTVRVGSAAVFTIKDGMTGVPVAGALFHGVLTDGNGQVTFTSNTVGEFRYKATKSGSIRSPAAIITVTA